MEELSESHISMNITLWMAAYGVAVAVYFFIKRKKRHYYVYASVVALIMAGTLGVFGYGQSVSASQLKALDKHFEECGGVWIIRPTETPWIVEACGKTYTVSFKGRHVDVVREISENRK